jgi:hypothetical protein
LVAGARKRRGLSPILIRLHIIAEHLPGGDHMTDTLTSSETALLRILGRLGIGPGEPVPMSVLQYHWGRPGGVTTQRDLLATIVGLQAQGLLEPAPDTVGNTGWALTPDGYDQALHEVG